MKKPRTQEDKLKRAIRDAIVIDPLISVQRLQDALFEKGFRTSSNGALDWHYVAKMRDKVHRQSVENVDHQKVSERVAEMKERYRLVFERLIRIAFYSDEIKKEVFTLRALEIKSAHFEKSAGLMLLSWSPT